MTGCARKAFGCCKKASRVASEGLVGVLSEGTVGTLVEVNSETDFVSRNETFSSLSQRWQVSPVKRIQSKPWPRWPIPIQGGQLLRNSPNIATIGENMSLRRMTKLSVNEGVVVSYVHNAAADGLGRIGVLVAPELLPLPMC